MISKKIKLAAGVLLAMGLVAAGGTAANAYDGTRGCASSSVPVTFSYTSQGSRTPNAHKHTNLSNTSQTFTDTKFEGGNKTTYSKYREIGYTLSGSNKSSYCS